MHIKHTYSMIGRMLSHYRIEEKLGAGGMGDVYQAEDTLLKRKVAIKLLPQSIAETPDALDRFYREARVVAVLNHPHIVTLHSIEEADGFHFLTMELVIGKTLNKILLTNGMMLNDVLALSLPLLDALAFAHERGVIHRDLKPSNVILGENGSLKVLDFGLAKFYLPAAELGSEFASTVLQTGKNVVMGTAPYMSPEQVRGKSVDARTDIFSVGVMLYEIVTGRRPFTGNSTAEIFSSILRDSPSDITDLRPELPQQLSRIIGRCLQKEPLQRFQNARDIYNELAELRNEKTIAPDIRFPIRALAVLPLTNLSGLPEEEYFADGMTDALITDLAKTGSVKVISRTSAMQYKKTTKPLNQIAQELRVDAIVEGSVFRSGDRVRITAQLIRAATDEHLWAERYDRKLEDVLSLQDEVVRAITIQVNATLNEPTAPAHKKEPRKVDPEVYLLQLRGRFALEKRTENSFRAALQLFQQAIDRDPSYAPSFIGLAESQNMLANYGFISPKDVLSGSMKAVEKALDLDESSAEAHRTLAFIHWQFEFAWEKAISEYERTLQLDPNSALSNYWFGAFLGVIGDFKRSHEFLRKAEEVDPLSLIIPSVQGWTYFFERRFQEAIPYYRRVLNVDSNYHVAQWFLGEALVELGEYSDGIDAFEKALHLAGRTSRLLGYLGYAYGRSGQTEKARELLQELEKREKEKYIPPYFFALIYCGLEERENAINRLEQAYAVRDTMLRDLKADPHWDRMRGEPRFQAMFRKMAFPNFQ